MIIVGIDPGLTGAVAILSPHGQLDVAVYDCPITQVVKGKSKKNEYLPYAMAELLAGLPPDSTHVYIEKVGAMPGQGVTSMFNFGKGFGLWIGIIAALKLPVTFVTPQAWKKELMAGMRDKDAARIRAMELFPDMSEQLKRKKDIGRADALLIAEYGRRKL